MYPLDILFKLKLSDIQNKLVVKKWNIVSEIQFIPVGMKKFQSPKAIQCICLSISYTLSDKESLSFSR